LYYSTAGDEIPVRNSKVSVNTLKKVQNGTMIAPPGVKLPVTLIADCIKFYYQQQKGIREMKMSRIT